MSAPTVELVWEDPPPAGRGRPMRLAEYGEIVEALRARPGEWAVVAVGAEHTGTAGQINAGRVREFQPAGEFEARRRIVRGELRVYARYVGEAVSSCVA